MQTTLPQDSLDRVSEMCRLRHERETVEQQMWLQSYRLRAEQESFVTAAFNAICDEEEVSRISIGSAQSAAFDRIAEQASEIAPRKASAALSRDDAEISRKRRQLQAQVRCMEFRAFWKQHQASGDSRSLSEDQSALATKRAATIVLRKAYEFSAPKFASDLEDLWKRGLAVAPDLQRQSHTPTIAPDVTPPAYHDFAAEMRHRYAEYSAQRRSSYSPEKEMLAASQSTSPRRTVATSPFATFARSGW